MPATGRSIAVDAQQYTWLLRWQVQLLSARLLPLPLVYGLH